MPRTYVALDLETTGLDPERDAILEVGAVKFQGEKVLEVFTSLVNPGRHIPRKVVDLTGITQEEAEQAPSLWTVLPRLQRFVGRLPVVGHNIAFDLAFLRRHGLFEDQEALDTFELAGVLVPHAGRYSLGALARELGVSLPATHRALDDARATHALFIALFQRASRLPVRILEEIVEAAAMAGWSARRFFQDAVRAAARQAFSGTIGAQLAARRGAEAGLPLLTPRSRPPRPLEPASERTHLDVDQLAAFLERDGPFARAFPGYEYRPQQVAMLRAVAHALNEGEHLLVEAGTGTGKSVAYLLPAIHWAVQNGERVVISTNTINLQEQLYDKDLPTLQKLLPFKFRATVLKGRSHYLCPAQLQALRKVGPKDPVEARVLAKVLLWLPHTLTGDGDELFLPNQAERAVWRRLSADNEACVPEQCQAYAEGTCFFYRARWEAEAAHLIIVNHALLLADVAVENRALPRYRYLIVDEAHHLERATTDQLSFQVDRLAVTRLLRELGGSRSDRRTTGLLGDVVVRCRAGLPSALRAQVEALVQELGEMVADLLGRTESFFDSLEAFLAEHGPNRHRSNYARRLRLTPGMRRQPSWSRVEIAWENAAIQLRALAEGLERLVRGLDNLEGYNVPDREDLMVRLAGMRGRLTTIEAQLRALVSEPSENAIYWLSAGPGNQPLSAHAAPLHVGPLVRQHLLEEKEAVVMTSATLRVAGSFDFIRDRLHAWEAEELAVGSPFDYARSTLVYLVDDIPEPNQSGYQTAVERGLVELFKATEGRGLALFTSYNQLRATARAIAEPLAEADIVVYEQGGGASRRQLLEQFKGAERAVLLGTRSFWEGVDIPGEALSCLAIIRLPFSVPDDPIFAARSETFEQPFFEYAVPETILRFLQGFGRLIRTRTDRGVVAIFDRRLLTKSYGQAFLDSLPEPTIRRGPLASLPGAAARWLARANSQGPED